MSGTLVLGESIVVDLRLSPARVSSGGVRIVLTCNPPPPPETTTTTVAETTTTTAPETTTTTHVDPATEHGDDSARRHDDDRATSGRRRQCGWWRHSRGWLGGRGPVVGRWRVSAAQQCSALCAAETVGPGINHCLSRAERHLQVGGPRR